MRPGFRENIRNGCTVDVTGAGPQISNTVSKFNSSALYNNGAASYLLLQPTNNFAIGTSNFTLEFWYYPLVYSTQTFFGTRPLSGTGPYMSTSMYGTGNRGINFYVNGSQVLLENNVFTTNTWTNIALVKNAGITKFYINGVASSNTYTDTNSYQASHVVIGVDDYAWTGLYLNGYMDEFRFSNVARYTSNFTPATQPFIDDLNTICLLHFDGSNGSQTFVDDNS
jgi:hypothetical protein